MIPGSQYAFILFMFVIFSVGAFAISMLIAKQFEVSNGTKVRNPGTLVTIFLVLWFSIMYSLSPVYLSMFKWAIVTVKGG